MNFEQRHLFKSKRTFYVHIEYTVKNIQILNLFTSRFHAFSFCVTVTSMRTNTTKGFLFEQNFHFKVVKLVTSGRITFTSHEYQYKKYDVWYVYTLHFHAILSLTVALGSFFSIKLVCEWNIVQNNKDVFLCLHFCTTNSTTLLVYG